MSTSTHASEKTHHEMEHVVFTDDYGTAIPANAEASVLMAMDLGEEFQVHDTDEWYILGMQECESLRQRLETFVFNEDEDDEEDDGTPKIASTKEKPDVQEAREVEEEADAAAAEDDEEWGREYSREYTDHEDEWILEAILKRRTTHEARSSTADARTSSCPQQVKGAYDDDGERQLLNYEYLCKWRWYAEPTWELRAALEELGYVKDLDEFDYSRLPNRTRKTRGVKPPGKKKNALSNLEELLGEAFLSKVQSTMKASSMDIIRYAPVKNNAVERRFVEQWKKHSLTHCPMILFHGTRSPNIMSIADRGLIVPGKSGVKVLNGSAYGVGIYAAKNSGYSRSYTDTDMMFVCVGLVGPQYQTVKEVGDICVFFDESMIAPLWLVQFSLPGQTEAAGLAHLAKEPERLTVPRLISLSFSGRGITHYNTAGANHAGPRSDAERRHRKAVTKKMIKQMPRYIKELYKDGVLYGKRT